MQIYVDEAGPFIPPRGTRRYSLVLALVIPTETQAGLFYQFLRLRDGWPQKGIEVKGSKLDENQTAELFAVLAAHGAIAEYCAIDMALHPDEVIQEFKTRQADVLTANLTPAHAAPVVQRIHSDAATIRAMANLSSCRPSSRSNSCWTCSMWP